VIGKGGSIIKTLRQETRAKIKVEDAIHGADERVIYISSASLRDGDGREIEREGIGGEEGEEAMLCSAQEALFRIHARITAREDAGKSSLEHGGLGLGLGLGGGGGEEEEEAAVYNNEGNDEFGNGSDKGPKSTQISARLLVSDGQVGCLIGKGGCIIEQMRKDIGAQIRVLPKSSLPPCAFPNDELVQVRAKNFGFDSSFIRLFAHRFVLRGMTFSPW
jgi:poly(rC)-binding protein 2/3/4